MASLFSAKPFVNAWEAPVAVSPTIRAARWGALVVGVLYGTLRYRSLKGPAKEEREAYMAKKAIEDAEASKIKAAASLAEMENLAVVAGIRKKE